MPRLRAGRDAQRHDLMQLVEAIGSGGQSPRPEVSRLVSAAGFCCHPATSSPTTVLRRGCVPVGRASKPPLHLESGRPRKDLSSHAPGLWPNRSPGKSGQLKVGIRAGRPKGWNCPCPKGLCPITARWRPSCSHNPDHGGYFGRAPAAAACSMRKGKRWALPPFI